MNIRGLQGWALVVSGAAALVVPVVVHSSVGQRFPSLGDYLLLIYSVLFLLGLPAIQSIQPKTKLWGVVGLVLLALPPIDRLVFEIINIYVADPLQLNQLTGSFWSTLESTGIEYSGYLLVGWLTIRARAFPVWTGWCLLAVGVFWTVMYVFQIDISPWPQALFPWVLALVSLVEAAALAGYGWGMIRYKTGRDIGQIESLKTQGDTQSLMEILVKENQSDWVFRLHAAETLAQTGNKRGLNYLISVYKGRNPGASEAAEKIIRELDTPQGNLALASKAGRAR